MNYDTDERESVYNWLTCWQDVDHQIRTGGKSFYWKNRILSPNPKVIGKLGFSREGRGALGWVLTMMAQSGVLERKPHDEGVFLGHWPLMVIRLWMGHGGHPSGRAGRDWGGHLSQSVAWLRVSEPEGWSGWFCGAVVALAWHQISEH